MRILKSLIIAFSIYSKIPVPQFEWKEEDMKYMLCFFPWIGAVIGILVYLWGFFCSNYKVGDLCQTFIGTAIPLVITGGFHVDGFMDTMDALCSYQSKEKKLLILKDSHIGAFSVIMLLAYYLIYLGAFSEISDIALLKIICAGFFLSRCLSGISVISFTPAKKEGMLHYFASSSHKNIVKAALYLQCVICVGFMLLQSIYTVVVVAAACVAYFYYGYRSKKEFGGITGDTAGYFVLICEGAMIVAAAVVNIFI